MRTLLGLLAALMLAMPAYSVEIEKKVLIKEKRAQAKMMKGDRMMRGLELTPEQKEKLKDFRQSNMDEMKRLRRDLEDQVTKLRRMVEDKAAESRIEDQIKAVKRVRKQMESAIERHMDKLERILTPVQRAKLLLKSGKHMGACAGCPMAQRQKGEKRRQFKRQEECPKQK